MRTHYGTAERLRAEAVAGTGLESFESRGDDDDGDAGHVSRPPLPPGAALSAREKLVALRAVIVDAIEGRLDRRAGKSLH